MARPYLFLLLVALVACIQGRLPSPQAATLSQTFSATTDLWLAGMPDGTKDGDGAIAGPPLNNSPTQISGITLAAGQALTFSATGSGDARFFGDPPDGNPQSFNVRSRPTLYGISGITAPYGALVGVFLGPERPDASAAPPALDFTTPASRDFTTLAPQLKQVFFIGDGLTSGGAAQQFTVPAGATRLFLGSVPEVTYTTGAGSFQVQVTGADAAAPVLSISKAADRSQVVPGDTLTYTLTYSNTGAAAATAPAVQDAIPAGTQLVSASFLDQNGQPAAPPVPGPNGKNPEDLGSAVEWYLGALPANSTGRVQLKVKVNATLSPEITQIKNTAYTLQAANAAVANGAPVATDVTSGQNPTILTIAKELTPKVTSVAPSGALSYTLTYTSASSGGTVNNPQVVDTLPSGASFVSAFFLDAAGKETTSPVAGPNGRNPEFSGGKIIWYLGKGGQKILSPGDTGKLKLNVKVNPLLDPSVTVISNRDYLVRGTAADGSEVQGSGGTPVDVPLGALQIGITANPATAAPGGTVTYSITVVNNTGSTTQKVVVDDTVPLGTQFVSASTGGRSAGGGVFTWSAGTLQPNARKTVTLTVQVPYDPDDTSRSITNGTYGATGLGTSGKLSATGVPLTIPIVGNTRTAPQLGLTLRAAVDGQPVPQRDVVAAIGQKILFSIDYFNTGDAAAQGLTVADAAPILTYPNGQTLKLKPTSISGGGRYDAARQTLTWSVGDLAPGAPAARGSSGTVSFTVTVPPGTDQGSRISTGFFSMSASNLNTVTNGTPNPFTVRVVPAVDFFLAASPDVSFLTAESSSPRRITYTLTYYNNGARPVTGVTLTNPLPTGTTLLNTSLPDPAPTLGGSTLTWALGTVAPRKYGQVQFAVEVTATSGSVSEQATIQGGGATVVSSPMLTPIITGPRLFVSIGAPLNATTADGTLTYRILYGNSGDVDADGVQVADGIPAGTTLVSTENGGVRSGNQVVWSGLSVPAHSAGTVSLTVRPTVAGRVLNGDCRITATGAGVALLPRAVANESDRGAGAVSTRVRSGGALAMLWDSLGDFLQGLGSTLGSVWQRLLNNPRAKADLQTLTANSRSLSIGGIDTLGLKNGVTVQPLGGGQVLVHGPDGATGVVSHDGGSVVSHDGGSITVIGSASAIQVNSALGVLSAEHLLQRESLLQLIAAGGGNLVAAGGGNLISQDGAGLLGVNGESQGAIATQGTANLVAAGGGNLIATGGGNLVAAGGGNLISQDGAGLISQDGGGVVSHDGGSVVSHDGGSVTQMNGGELIASQNGRLVAVGGGN